MPQVKHIYKGKLLSLARRRVCLPNGYTVSLELVSHPGAALVVPFITKTKIIMIRQFRPAIGAYLYELPAGTLNSGEPALSCARREIREETGYSARRFYFLGEVYPVPGYSTERIKIYRAEGLTRCRYSHRDKDEVIENHIVGRKELSRLFRNKELSDAKTICALALCGWI